MNEDNYGDVVLGTSVMYETKSSKEEDILFTNVMNDTISDFLLEDCIEHNTSIPSVVLEEKKCYLCGLTKEEHSKCNGHKFIECNESYRCTKCGKYFYEHNHKKNSCYSPPRK